MWRIYEGRLANPIAHPIFQGQPASFHEQARGKPVMDVLLKPGDLLYIPRGTYHDAIAQSDGTVHVAFGATAVIGLDLISKLFERAVHEPSFRADLPRRHAPGGEAAFDQHVRALAARLAELATSETTLAQFRSLQDAYRYMRGGFELSGALFDDQTYRVTSDGFSVVRRGGDWVLRRADKSTAIPAGFHRPVSWIIARARFASEELDAAFPELDADQRAELLRALKTMGVIAQIPDRVQ